MVVHPQPRVDAAAFLVVPPWCKAIARLPICLQVHQRGARPLISMEFVDPVFSKQDIVSLLRESLQPEACIFVGDRASCLAEHGIVEALSGMLVLAYPPRVEPRIQPALAWKLFHALEELADIDEEGVPDPDTPPTACSCCSLLSFQLPPCCRSRLHMFLTGRLHACK